MQASVKLDRVRQERIWSFVGKSWETHFVKWNEFSHVFFSVKKCRHDYFKRFSPNRKKIESGRRDCKSVDGKEIQHEGEIDSLKI